MPAQLVQLAAPAADDEGERPPDPIGEAAELSNMPIDALTPTAAGCELKSQDLDLGALSD